MTYAAARIAKDARYERIGAAVAYAARELRCMWEIERAPDGTPLRAFWVRPPRDCVWPTRDGAARAGR